MKNDGGPAFPGYDQMNPKTGLTKREYFAGQAMMGLLANSSINMTLDAFEITDGMKIIAGVSKGMADAIIAELAKE